MLNMYQLYSGANLISFPHPGSMQITDAIPNLAEGYFEGIIGQGVAASQISPQIWVGSLSSFQGSARLTNICSATDSVDKSVFII